MFIIIRYNQKRKAIYYGANADARCFSAVLVSKVSIAYQKKLQNTTIYNTNFLIIIISTTT